MAEATANDKPALLVFSDDWGRHPSSCQHLIRRLLPEYQVWWVNTIGMRRPSLNLSTFRRGLEKLGHWFSKNGNSAAVPRNLHIIDPTMWPWFSTPRDRWINQKLLLRALTRLVRSLPSRVIAVTTIPIVTDLVGQLPVDRWVYYCVDDFSLWPGLDQPAMKGMEDDLVRKADRLIAASDTLQEKLAGLGRESQLMTHGVDLEFWQMDGPVRDAAATSQHERPLVVFWGTVDRRMDVRFVRQLALEMTEGTILLVGPVDDPDPVLLDSSRVVHVPPLPLEELPWLGAEADVLIMPYRDLPVTRAMQPLKLKEYLATGKPTVVRDLPSTRPWANCLDVSRSPEEFSALVRLRLAEGVPESQRHARDRLVQESWTIKAREFERFALAEGIVPVCPSSSDAVLTPPLK